MSVNVKISTFSISNQEMNLDIQHQRLPASKKREGAPVGQPVNHLTLGLGSGCALRVWRSSCIGGCAQHRVCILTPALCPSPLQTNF